MILVFGYDRAVFQTNIPVMLFGNVSVSEGGFGSACYSRCFGTLIQCVDQTSVFWSATYCLSVLCVEGLVSASSILMVKTRNKKVFASSFEFESLPRSVCCVEIMLG